jgi:hypothetical protein
MLVNAQSAGVVSLEAVGTTAQAQDIQHEKLKRLPMAFMKCSAEWFALAISF